MLSNVRIMNNDTKSGAATDTPLRKACLKSDGALLQKSVMNTQHLFSYLAGAVVNVGDIHAMQ